MVRIKSKKGSTMVEAALVFPILIFVVVTVPHLAQSESESKVCHHLTYPLIVRTVEQKQKSIILNKYNIGIV